MKRKIFFVLLVVVLVFSLLPLNAGAAGESIDEWNTGSVYSAFLAAARREENNLTAQAEYDMASHRHTVGYVWLSDGMNHWKVCSTCGEKVDFGMHRGGKADCVSRAYCEICDLPYGEMGDHLWSSSWDYSTVEGHCHTCLVDVCGVFSPPAAHNPGPAATDTAPQTCVDCGYVINAVVNHTHEIYWVERKEPTCGKYGNLAYYACTCCGKWFADAEATKEITDPASVVIPKLPHQMGTRWSKDEKNHFYACICGAITDAAGHNDSDFDSKCDVCSYQMYPENTEETMPAPGKDESIPDGGASEARGNAADLRWLWIVAVAVVCFGGSFAVTLLLASNRKRK